MYIYQHGNVDEKNEFSFALFDEDQDGKIDLNDMYRVMEKFTAHWSTLQGSQTIVDKEQLSETFKAMDTDGNGQVELDEYKTVLRQQPGLFNWFSILNNNTNVNPYDEENEDKTGLLQDSSHEEMKMEQEESIRQEEKVKSSQDLIKFYFSL